MFVIQWFFAGLVCGGAAGNGGPTHLPLAIAKYDVELRRACDNAMNDMMVKLQRLRQQYPPLSDIKTELNGDFPGYGKNLLYYTKNVRHLNRAIQTDISTNDVPSVPDFVLVKGSACLILGIQVPSDQVPMLFRGWTATYPLLNVGQKVKFRLQYSLN